jgi:putative alpha-1,2-mannosidase
MLHNLSRMNRILLLLFISLFFALFYVGCNTAKTNKITNSDPPDLLTQYVNPFIGTKQAGNTFPRVVAPFGIIQPGPDADDSSYGTASNYDYHDLSIVGFSMTHFSGTGIPSLGDFLFMPAIKSQSLNKVQKRILIRDTASGILIKTNLLHRAIIR